MDGVYVVFMVFYFEGFFKVFIIRNGKNFFGSLFKVIIEKSVLLKRIKLLLISLDIECMREVGGVFKKVIGLYELWI